MKRINIVGEGQRRIRVTSKGQSEVSPGFLMEAFSAKFVPELSDAKKVRELNEPPYDMRKHIRDAPAAE